MHKNILKPEKTALVVIDMQDAFVSAIFDFPLILSKIIKATRSFQILELPILITEQYPKGLGRTAGELRNVLPEDFAYIEKNTFSSCGASMFKERLRADKIEQILLCGVETHVCVNQTAHDLLSDNIQVHLLTDAVASRFTGDKETALQKMFLSGAIPSTVEMALFELMRNSKHEKFKEIQALIK